MRAVKLITNRSLYQNRASSNLLESRIKSIVAIKTPLFLALEYLSSP